MFQVIVLLTTATLLGFGAWGCARIRQEFDPVLFLPADSYLRRFLAVSVALFGLAVIGALAATTSPVVLAIALGAVWAFGWHLGWQLTRLDEDDPENCMRIFRSNRDAGLIPSLIFAVLLLL